MMTTMTSVDESVRDAVLRQLAWSPEVDASMIGVSVHDGIATLSGYVSTYTAKLAAERVIRNVYGVKGIANELEVRLAQDRIDPDIAYDAVEALKRQGNVPAGLGVTVRGGYITLTGTVEWMFQKAAAGRAVKHLRGVHGVFNHIEIEPKASPKDVQKKITEALHRHAALDARRIHVETEGSRVILSGNARSWTERDEVVRAAWAAPGVTTVDNQIAVIP
jgi:osmotically-inducible protein OsmY